MNHLRALAASGLFALCNGACLYRTLSPTSDLLPDEDVRDAGFTDAPPADAVSDEPAPSCSAERRAGARCDGSAPMACDECSPGTVLRCNGVWERAGVCAGSSRCEVLPSNAARCAGASDATRLPTVTAAEATCSMRGSFACSADRTKVLWCTGARWESVHDCDLPECTDEPASTVQPVHCPEFVALPGNRCFASGGTVCERGGAAVLTCRGESYERTEECARGCEGAHSASRLSARCR